MAVEKVAVNTDLTYRKNLTRPLSAEEFDGNLEKVANALTDLANKVNELVDAVNSLDERVSKLENNS